MVDDASLMKRLLWVILDVMDEMVRGDDGLEQ